MITKSGSGYFNNILNNNYIPFSSLSLPQTLNSSRSFSSSSICSLASDKDLLGLIDSNSLGSHSNLLANINSSSLDLLKIQEKTNINFSLKSYYLAYPFSLHVFIKLLVLNLNLNSNYTILFQYHSYQLNLNYMITRQCGLIVKDSHDINYYIDLYNFFIENLEMLTDLYQIQLPDIIIINIKQIILNKEFLLDDIKNISLNKSITKLVETKSFFRKQIIPLTYKEEYLGNLLVDEIRLEYLNKLIDLINNHQIVIPNKNKYNELNDSQSQINYLNKVKGASEYKVFLSKDTKHLIISNSVSENNLIFR